MHSHYLTTLLKPRSIAVFGASERPNTVGAVLLRNIIEGDFRGTVHPINPRYETIQGLPAQPRIENLDTRPDLAVIATPAATVPSIMEEIGRHGTRAAVVLSAGFRETGAAGRRLEDEVLGRARHHGIRFLGPNCLGMIRPDVGLNATVSKSGAQRGDLAVVSQSGALCTAILDWAGVNGVGFSCVISTGISADIDFGDVLDFLVADPATRSIMLYVEGVRDARRFMSGLRAAARVKPVIVMKTGRHLQGWRAVLSHSGALVGYDDVFDAAIRRAGVVRVESFSDLFGAAKTVASGLRVGGNRLVIVTNGGGIGVMAADRLADKGLPVVALSPATIDLLNERLPNAWSHDNPVDILGDADPQRFREAISICIRDPQCDALLAILTPQAMTQPEAVAREVVELAAGSSKPIMSCWMGESQLASSRALFLQHHVPSYRTPEAAVDAFHLLAAHHHNQQLLLEVPEPLSRDTRPDVEAAQAIIRAALAEGRETLSDTEVKGVLAAFHIPTVRSRCARDETEAAELAADIGFPVVLKVDAPDLDPRPELGRLWTYVCTAKDLRTGYHGIRARVQTAFPRIHIRGVVIEEMREFPNARELAISVINGPVFGPAISVGSSALPLGAPANRAIALPPLNAYLAGNLIKNSGLQEWLLGTEQVPAANMERIEDMLLRVSEMVCELPELKELELRPVLVDEKRAAALGARIAIGARPAAEQPYAHMAIHPYPGDLVARWQDRAGTKVVIRPIRPEDAVIEDRFVHGLSARSKYFRFMYALADLTPVMLSRLTQIDYDREMALIAVVNANAREREIGVARYVINPDGDSCEFAIVVADDWHGRGLASELLRRLIEVASRKGLELMEGEVLRKNTAMLQLARKFGFDARPNPDDREIMTITRAL